MMIQMQQSIGSGTEVHNRNQACLLDGDALFPQWWPEYHVDDVIAKICKVKVAASLNLLKFNEKAKNNRSEVLGC